MSEQEVLSPITFSGPQEVALRALAGGAHVMEAAQEADVRRETVSRWLAQEEFRVELLRRREELWAQYRDRLTAMVPVALDALYVLCHGPDYYGPEHFDPRVRLDAVALVLRISGLLPQRGPALAVQVNTQVNVERE
jgi:hypothetical protein